MYRLKLLGRFGIAGLYIGVNFLGAGAVSFFDRGEIGVRFKPQQFKRAHFIGAARTIARSGPAVIRAFSIPRVLALFGAGAFVLFGLLQPFEIIPAGIIFCGVFLAEIPPIAAVGGFGRGAIARLGATMVIYLSVGMIEKVVEQLLQGAYTAATPAAVVCRASWEDELIIQCTLSELAEKVHEAGIDRQALIIVGDVLAARREGLKAKSLLYDGGFSHGFREVRVA